MVQPEKETAAKRATVGMRRHRGASRLQEVGREAAEVAGVGRAGLVVMAASLI